MRGDTSWTHERIAAIGHALGFRAEREVSLAGCEGYRPRLDVLWSLPLTEGHLAATCAVGARLPLVESALPIGAWEVEGSDASTKGMQADLANMRVSGSFLSFLAVRGGTKDNLYDRAVALERSQAHYFGQRRVLVLDCAWVDDLARMPLSNAVAELADNERGGSGGTGAWAKGVTRELTQRGKSAGFRVLAEYQRPRDHVATTRSKIDLVWALPLPAGLATLAAAVLSKRAEDRANDGVGPCAAVPVVAFEIENDASKHGSGGLLNLASHAMCGVFVAGTARAAEAAEAAKATYASAFPLGRVTIHKDFVR
jgi:hypothetical protein